MGPPSPPTDVHLASANGIGSVSWAAGDVNETAFTLSAGTTPGASNLAVVTFPASVKTVASPLPVGTYFVRLTATNRCGTSGPSREVQLTLRANGASNFLPPQGVTATVAGNVVSVNFHTLTWWLFGDLAFDIEAGSAPGRSDYGSARVSVSSGPGMPSSGPPFSFVGVPSGTYYVRVRTFGGGGLGAASEDVRVVVP